MINRTFLSLGATDVPAQKKLIYSWKRTVGK